MLDLLLLTAAKAKADTDLTVEQKWSDQEEGKLKMAFRLFGNRWDKVAHMVSTRSAASCEAKHTALMNPEAAVEAGAKDEQEAAEDSGNFDTGVEAGGDFDEEAMIAQFMATSARVTAEEAGGRAGGRAGGVGCIR
jgi:hypothetical protein